MDLHPAPVASEAPVLPEPAVVRADTAGIVLEWRAPEFSLEQTLGDDGQPYSILKTPGWTQTGEPGHPQLPFASVLAVVPPAGDVTLHVQVLERTRHWLPHPVAPARAPVLVDNPPTDVAWDWLRDERAYAGVGFHPAEVVILEEAGWMHGYRLMQLTFYPLRFDPATNGLEVTNQVRVELRFQDETPDTPEDGWDSDDPFIPVLQHSVVNPAQVTRFVRQARPATAPPAPTNLDKLRDETTAALTLGSPPANTEYLIIAHSSFITAVAPLATHRAISDGLHVFSTTVEAVGGSVNPLAIRDYISRTYHSSTPPALKYVLLVGDGVQNPQSLSQSTAAGANLVPPYLIPDPWQPGKQAASDNRFVTLDGSDTLADVFIGRLPVNTIPEATTVVNKILAYELNPPPWPWSERVLFFAGNESDGHYHDYSDQVYAALPVTYTGQRAYFCTANCNQSHLYTPITAAHNAAMQALNAGGLLASYVGHSSWQQWAVDPQTFAPMFHLDDVPNLHNGGALPVVLEMTCYTSDFAYPSGNTLDESLLRWPGGGAVATWGPTTWGASDGHTVLHQAFFDAVFNDHITRLGPATEAAKANPQLKSLGCLDLRDTFVLLGDPAMDLNLNIVPWRHTAFLPATLRSYH